MTNTKRILVICLTALLLLASCSNRKKHSTSGKENGKPNIIMFLVDDMGWQDTSLPFWDKKTKFNETYHTPAMEKLASQGMMFTQAYSCSVCSPTRVSLMSGMNAARHKVTNWTLRRNVSQDAKDSILSYPEWNMNGAQPVDSIVNSVYITSLPQLLKDNGYYTIHCGKAHFGAIGTPGADPLQLGFEVNIAGHAGGAPGSYQGLDCFGNNTKSKNIWGVPGLEKYHGKDIHLTEVLTIEAKQALDSALAINRPFYLYMSHYAVHGPIQPDKRFHEKYKIRGMDEIEAKYASMIEGMDKSLNDLMDYLDEKGIADNTIILFMSDNGGLSAVARGGEPHTHNLPLNSGKGSAYEGGIREPMIVRWPGKVRPGSACDDYLIIEDFYPTILEMAGVQNYTTIQHVDGISFVPLLTQSGNTSKDRDLFWHYPNKWGPTGPGVGATSAIRSGDWKLVYWYKDKHFDLFNIREDIGEKNNIAVQQPGRVKELAKKLGDYLRSVDAQRPSYKKEGELAPWPDEVFTL